MTDAPLSTYQRLDGTSMPTDDMPLWSLLCWHLVKGHVRLSVSDICTTPFCFQASYPTPFKSFLIVQYLIYIVILPPLLWEETTWNCRVPAFRQTQHFPGISGCCETWAPRAHYAPWRVPTNGCSNKGSGELEWDASKVTMLNKALDRSWQYDNYFAIFGAYSRWFQS